MIAKIGGVVQLPNIYAYIYNSIIMVIFINLSIDYLRLAPEIQDSRIYYTVPIIYQRSDTLILPHPKRAPTV